MEWISVKDKMPKDRTTVIWSDGKCCWMEYMEFDIPYRYRDNVQYKYCNKKKCIHRIQEDSYLYWMPYPELPK